MPGFRINQRATRGAGIECAGGDSLSQTADAEKLAFCSAWRNVDPGTGDAASVWLSDTAEQVNLLVVEPGENAALCLLAQPGVVIAGRTMQLGDAIKIMNDRLKPQVHCHSFSLEQAV